LSVFDQAIQNLGLNPNDPVSPEAFAAVQAEAARIRAATGTPTHDPRKAPTVQISDLSLSVELLTEAGATREEAFQSLAEGNKLPADALAARRAQHQERADAEAAAAYEASPAGRREAAETALQTRAERRRMAEGARELLRQSGYSEDVVASWDNQTALVNAGLEESNSARYARELDERAARAHPEVPSSPEPISSTDGRLSDFWSES
jgi:hypothetical protein